MIYRSFQLKKRCSAQTVTGSCLILWPDFTGFVLSSAGEGSSSSTKIVKLPSTWMDEYCNSLYSIPCLLIFSTYPLLLFLASFFLSIFNLSILLLAALQTYTFKPLVLFSCLHFYLQDILFWPYCMQDSEESVFSLVSKSKWVKQIIVCEECEAMKSLMITDLMSEFASSFNLILNYSGPDPHF